MNDRQVSVAGGCLAFVVLAVLAVAVWVSELIDRLQRHLR